MNTPIVLDVEFGISQLSGNKGLLLTLLRKFVDEYRQTQQKLSALIEASAWEDARVLVHTLKGVAGNLGCVALHASCKALEGDIKEQQRLPANFPHFVDILNETIATIDALSSEQQLSDAAASVQQVQPEQQDSEASKTAILSALQANEFIPPEKLDEWLNQISDDAGAKSAIQEAVDELDYGIAIDLVNQLP